MSSRATARGSSSAGIPTRIATRLRKIRRLANRLAREFGIFEPFSIGAVSPRCTDFDAYGMCHAPSRGGRFVIVVRTFSRFDGSDLPSDCVVDTVCHEMAHIPFMNHGRAWRILYHSMLRWAAVNNVSI